MFGLCTQRPFWINVLQSLLAAPFTVIVCVMEQTPDNNMDNTEEAYITIYVNMQGK